PFTRSSSSAAWAARQALRSNRLGGAPNRCRKQREKSDDDAKPLDKAIVVSDALPPCDIIDSAFSSRRRLTKSARVTPVSDWNTRLKWNCESIAARDTLARRNCSSRWLMT